MSESLVNNGSWVNNGTEWRYFSRQFRGLISKSGVHETIFWIDGKGGNVRSRLYEWYQKGT